MTLGAWDRGSNAGISSPHPDPLPQGERESQAAASGVSIRLGWQWELEHAGVETPHPSPLPQGEREHAPAVIPGRGAAVILGSLLSFPCQREARRNTRVPRGFSNVILLVFLSYCSSVILSVAKDMQFASFFFPLFFPGTASTQILRYAQNDRVRVTCSGGWGQEGGVRGMGAGGRGVAQDDGGQRARGQGEEWGRGCIHEYFCRCRK